MLVPKFQVLSASRSSCVNFEGPSSSLCIWMCYLRFAVHFCLLLTAVKALPLGDFFMYRYDNGSIQFCGLD